MTSPEASQPWVPTWDGAAYAANTGHHRAHDAAFLATFPVRPADHLLDIGCGSGDFTAKVAALVPGGHVVGLDPQPTMLAEARRRAGANQSFVEGPAQSLATLIPEGECFDGVYSRSAMQWVPMPDHPGILANVHRLLRPDGWFRLEMSGAGNIPKIAALLDDVSATFGGLRTPWAFPDAGVYLDLLEAAGFEVEGGFVRTLAQRRPFDEASLLGWLRSQGFVAYLHSLPPVAHGAFREAVERRLSELRRHDGTFDQTFVRLDVLAYRR
jgi:trans-aconitate 2-methyltransferase